MNTNKMKLGLMYIFSDSNTISKKSKLQLINFIEHADSHQLKVLFMDGEITAKDTIDEITKQIIDDRFNSLSEAVPLIAAAAVAGAVVLMANKRRNTLIKRYEAGCYGKKGKVLKICMQQATEKAYKDEIQMYKSQMSKCNKTRKPDKCKASLQKHILKAQNKIGKGQKKLKY